MAHRPPSTAGASGDTTGAPAPVTDWHAAGTLRAACLPRACALVPVPGAVHPGGADENWADRSERRQQGQRQRAGHLWLPRHCDDPETGPVAWDASPRRGSRGRVVLQQSRHAALQEPRRPAAAVPPTRSTAQPPAAPDWLHHGPRPVHPPGDGRGRAHRPAAAGRPNQSPQTTRTISAAQLVLDAWHSVR
jgi:hypothetical protein